MRPGRRRLQLDATLRAAYDDGLLSQSTFVERLGEVLTPGVLRPERLVGDLTLRRTRPARLPLDTARCRALLARFVGLPERAAEPLLALDWTGAPRPITVGRDPACDICLSAETISRHHARLIFRDGAWIVQDLDSTNGTTLNGRPVGRARLRPGDHLNFAGHSLRVD